MPGPLHSKPTTICFYVSEMKQITTSSRFHHYLMKFDAPSSICVLEHEENPPKAVSL